MSEPQAGTLRLFTALGLLRPSWAGSLLLGVGLNQEGRLLALASLATGAASLFLESGPRELREAQRQGCCTFCVTTLDEALRALKNEVRQARAISIALSGDPSHWLPEMVARGVQPQAVAFARSPRSEEDAAARVLLLRGAVAVHGLGLMEWQNGVDLAATLSNATGEGWRATSHLAESPAERRQADREFLELAERLAAAERLLPRGEPDPIAQSAARWLRVAPTLFPRDLERVYWQRKRDVSA